MSKVKPHKQIEIQPLIVAESRTPYGLRTYISLFSSAGIGCYGFKEENFHCIGTYFYNSHAINQNGYFQ